MIIGVPVFAVLYAAGEKYNIISAPAEEIIRRIIASQDQLGFAYFEESQLEKVKKMFPENHIGYYILKTTKTVLYCRNKAEHEKQNEILLIQGVEDYYSGISLWKNQTDGEEEKRKLQVKVTTNSDWRSFWMQLPAGIPAFPVTVLWIRFRRNE